MITIKVSPTCFITKDIFTKELPYVHNQPIFEYLKELDTTNCRVILLGKKLKDLSIVPSDNSIIIITPDLKDIVSGAIAAITWVGTAMGASAANAFWVGALTLGAVGYAIYTMCNVPGIPGMNSGKSPPSTYSWEGIRTLQDIGVPVPIIYGRIKTGGNIINQYLRTDGDKTYLNLLIALSEGEINSVSNIKVNENPIENYAIDSDNTVKLNTKLLKNTPTTYTTPETAVSGFRLVFSFPDGLWSTSNGKYWSVSYLVEYKLHSDPTYTSLGVQIISDHSGKSFKKTFTQTGLAGGQYDIRVTRLSNNSSSGHVGDMYLYSVDTSVLGVTYQTRRGTVGQSVIPNYSDLHDLMTMSVNLVKDSPYVYTTVRNDVETFELYLTYPRGLFRVGSSGGVGSWTVSYLVEYKLHTDASYMPLGVQTVSAKNQSNFLRIFRKTGLAAGQYDIRVTRTTDDTNLTHIGDMYLTNVDEIVTDDIAYNDTALLAVEAVATDQLSGSVPNVTCIVEGRRVMMPEIRYNGELVDWEDYYWDAENEQYKLFEDDSVCTWDGVTLSEQWGANPIWCLSIQLNNRYGLGDDLAVADIDDDLLLEMSRVCELKVSDGEGGHEKRYRLDMIIDSQEWSPRFVSRR